jgi:beta-carotene 3-hydroxylase
VQVAGYALITLAAFVGMEAFAWAVHRYVMHGPGWGWHRSHHEAPAGEGPTAWWEKNDLYAVVFAGIATVMFVVGSLPGWTWLWFVGLGCTLYGVMYFIVHDGFVHQRWPFRIHPKRGYAKRLVQAHRIHHATHGRDGAVSFGFLYAPEVRRLKAQLQRQARA